MLARSLRPDEVTRYREEGVVRLPAILDLEWVTELRAVFDAVLADERPQLNSLDMGQIAGDMRERGAELVTPDTESVRGRFVIRTFNWQSVPGLVGLGTRAPLPELAAGLMGADRINFFGDQLFLKEAGSVHRTAFHQDAPYFHLEGDQCCSIWIPLDVVDRENGAMGYVRGSHRWPIHQSNIFVSQSPLPGSPGERLPDIEGNERDFDVVYHPSEPGDAIVHHVRTVHGSTGNTSSERVRRAAALRYLGDDIRYLERKGAPPDSAKSPHLSDGDLMDSPEFPLIWDAASGYRSVSP